jgi:hypothetical protein
MLLQLSFGTNIVFNNKNKKFNKSTIYALLIYMLSS